MNYEFNRSPLAERPIFLAHYQTITYSWKTLFVPLSPIGYFSDRFCRKWTILFGQIPNEKLRFSFSGKIRSSSIRILMGDRVKFEVSRYDSSKGMIYFTGKVSGSSPGWP